MLTYILTGASSGLGKEIFHLLTEQGRTVHRILHPTNAIDERENGIDIGIDLAVPRSILPSTLSRLNLHPLDSHVLINCAGINRLSKFEDLKISDVEDTLSVNFISSFVLVQALLPDLRGGVVCNIVSDAYKRPMSHSLAYNASKAAMHIATKQMARELTKPYSICILSVNPGKMHSTQMSRDIDDQVCKIRGWTKEKAIEYQATNSVSGIESDPKRIAKHIVRLCKIASEDLTLSGASIDLVG